MRSNEWNIYKLDEVYDFSSGLSKKKEEFGFGFPFLTFKEIFNNFFIPNYLTELVNSSERERNSCSIKRGDVFLLRTSEKQDELALSSVALKDYENATFNGFTKRLRPKNKLILPEYAGYYFRSPKFRHQVTGMSSMTTRASLNNSMLSALEIIVPPLEEQKAIASILSSLDKKIELNKEMNRTLEEMGQAIFKNWFVEFEYSNELGTTHKLNDGKVVESKLGMIPEGWKIKEVNEITKVNIGKTPPRKEKQWFSTDSCDIRWLSIKNMGESGAYIFKTSEYLTHEAVEKFRVKRIPDNTVLLSFKLTVGRVAISIGEMLSNEAIAHFLIDSNSEITTEYLYLYLKNFKFNSLGSTSSIATAVNSRIIKTIPILVPPNSVLSKFQTHIKPLFEKIKSNTIEFESLTELRDLLLPKLISGDFTIKDVEKEVEECLQRSN